MEQEWASLETLGFPLYEISNDGLVRNSHNGKMMKLSGNQDGIIRVGLMKQDINKQVTLSVLRLVARMFVPGSSASFDTPIQLNGNRSDCSAENIMWRPRWFAVKYFNQFEETDTPLFKAEIYDVETSREYMDSREVASVNGLLESAVMKSVVDGSPCFPTWQRFARVSQ